ncbi:MAG TPA: PAS domain S-box protein, partial [Candidatus Acidoferrum sp.]|nr:PAS domain S-box protein [Candidatus Acidoferrum sp.]
CLSQILDAAVALTSADKGNIQLLDATTGTLTIAAQQGFAGPFLRFFASVRAGEASVCGAAMRWAAGRVIVEDVTQSAILAGQPSLDVLMHAGVRAVQSTPLVSSAGRLLGMISTHFAAPRRLAERELRLMDLLARQAADYLERKQAEEAKARLAAIVESSDDAIIGKDLNGVIMSWNWGAERLFGYTAQEAIGQPVTILFQPERFDEEPGILERIRRGESIEHYETIRRRKDGTLFDVSLTVSPVKNAEGKVIGVSKVARDITYKVRAREQLEQTVAERTASLKQAIAQMEEFSYSVSHDLRAPVRAIEGYARILNEDCRALLPAKAQGHLDKISRSTERMNRLINDVLTLSRVAQNEVRLHEIALHPFIEELIEQYPEMQQANIELGELQTVIGDDASLSQAVSNLLSNAIKFVTPGDRPHVRVWCEPEGESVRIWVADKGIGIAPELQGKLFGIFQRLRPNEGYEGTGIGLAIVRKAVERMGGKVGVESDGKTGSRFWVELKGITNGAGRDLAGGGQ